MSFNNGFTAITGATYTAAQYNTYVRDNFTAIWVGTTQGDLEYYTGATAKARLAKGAAYQTLKMNSGETAPEWVGFVGASARRSSNQSIGNATYTDIAFTTEDFDIGDFYDAGNPTRLTAPYAGYYLVQGGAKFEANSTGIREFRITKDNTYQTGSGELLPGTGERAHVGMIVNMSAAQYVELEVWQNSGGSLNITDARLAIAFLGP